MLKWFILSLSLLISSCGLAEEREDFTNKIIFNHNDACIYFKYPISDRAFNVDLTMEGTYPTELVNYSWKFKIYEDDLGVGLMDTKHGTWNGLTIVYAFTTGWLSSEKAADGILLREDVDTVKKKLEERGIILSDITFVEKINPSNIYINSSDAQTMIYCDFQLKYGED